MSRNSKNVIQLTTQSLTSRLANYSTDTCDCVNVDCRSQVCVDYLDIYLPDELITSTIIKDKNCCLDCCGTNKYVPDPVVTEDFLNEYGVCFSPCDLNTNYCVNISNQNGFVLFGECKPYDGNFKLPSYWWYPNDTQEYRYYGNPAYLNPHYDYNLMNYNYLSTENHNNIPTPTGLGYCHCQFDSLYPPDSTDTNQYYIGSDWLWYYWPDGFVIDSTENQISNEDYMGMHGTSEYNDWLYDLSHEMHFEHPFNDGIIGTDNIENIITDSIADSGGQKIVEYPTNRYCKVTPLPPINEDDLLSGSINTGNIPSKSGSYTFDVSNGVNLDGVEGYLGFSENRQLLDAFCRTKGYSEHVSSKSRDVKFDLRNIFTKNYNDTLAFYTRKDYLILNKIKRNGTIKIFDKVKCFGHTSVELVDAYSENDRYLWSTIEGSELVGMSLRSESGNSLGINPYIDIKPIDPGESDNEDYVREEINCESPCWQSGNMCCCPLNTEGGGGPAQCAPIAIVGCIGDNDGTIGGDPYECTANCSGRNCGKWWRY